MKLENGSGGVSGALFFREPGPDGGRSYPSPLRFILVVAVSVFLLETAVMLVMRFFPSLSFGATALIDAVALTILSIPLLYFFVYRPMAAHISERRRVEDALREWEEKSQSLLEQMSDVFWKVDSECRYVEVSGAVRDVFGLDPEEVVGRGIFDFIPKDEALKTREKCEAIRSSRLPLHDFECRIVRKNGAIATLLVNAVPRIGGDGSFVGYLGTIRDITGRKRAEEALRVSEMKYRIIADNNYDWEFWISPRGHFLHSSPSCKRITGYAAREFEENPSLMGRIVHPDDQEIFSEYMSRAMESRGGEEAEFRVIRRDGQTRVLASLSQPIHDEDGQFLGIRGSNRDITEKKRTEAELRESERRFREIVENTRLATVILDLNGNIFYLNDYTLELVGYAREELVGRDFFAKLSDPAGARELKDFLYRDMEKGVAPSHNEGSLVTRKGERLVISWNNTILKDARGRVIGVTPIGEDVTARRRAEETLKRAHDELESRVRERTAELSSLIEQSPMAIAVLDMDGRLEQMNRAWEDFYAATFGPPPPAGYCVFEDAALERYGLARKVREVFETGKVFISDPLPVERDGESGGGTRWIVTRFSGVAGEDGKVRRVINMVEDITERKSSEEALRLVVEGAAAKTGDGFFRDFVKSMAGALGVRYFFVAELAREREAVRTVAFWESAGFLGNVEYNLGPTPCSKVYETREPCFYPQGVQSLFPEDRMLVEMEAESYYGVPILGSSGEPLGHIGILDDKPMRQNERMESILRIFAARAGAELARRRTEEALRESHETMAAVMDGIDAGVYVADMKTYEILFANKYLENLFGDVEGKMCWKALRKNQDGPCSFCSNEKLVTEDGEPAGVYVWELQNTVDGRWYEIRDRAIRWIDGRMARMEIATDITERKRMEEALNQLRPVT